VNFTFKKSLITLSFGLAVLPFQGAWATSTMPSSGSCAMLIVSPTVSSGLMLDLYDASTTSYISQPNGAPPIVNPQGYTGGSHDISTLAVLTFTSSAGGTLQANDVSKTISRTGGQTNTQEAYSNQKVTGTFSVQSGNLGTNSYVLTLTALSGGGGGNNSLTVNAIPINNGASILLQDTTYGKVGVCQF
jgi:hypothetical protein